MLKLQRKALSSPFTSEFSIEFESPIWELSPSGNQLLITTRDKEKLKTQFSLFDLVQQEFVFSNISFEEDWWVSVYLFNGQQVVFQHYNDTQDIENRSVFAMDSISQEILWSVDGVKLQQVNRKTIKCEEIATKEVYYVDVSTGDHINQISFIKDEMGGKYPQTYTNESTHFELLSKFIQKDRQGLVGAIDYMEYDDTIILSANFKKENTYSLYLFVYDIEGELIEEIALEENLAGQAVGTFFILDQALIFVNHKHLIEVRKLS